MKFVFMGTPDFAVSSFLALLEAGHQATGVFTQPDKPKGRGHELTPPPVKIAAMERGIPVFQPQSLRNGEGVRILSQLEFDVIVVAAYGKILPPDVLALPKYGCINVHASLLPRYRGAAPINWVIINGEKKTGITTMYMAEGLDTGDMLLKSETPILPEDTAEDLHDRLAAMGGELICETLRLAEEGKLNPIPQEDADSCYAPMLTKETCRIDFSVTMREVVDRIRGLSPFPTAVTMAEDKQLKLYRAVAVPEESGEPGTLLSEDRLLVAVADGAVEITELAAPGKRRMPGRDFMRGARLSKGTKLGIQ
ncbi:MAG: methionyl-tRNA formyltransferase [Ruminococcaceae bacterium]|nr:methionyl-tRNA formyltransferase [Oscillospiraceae bacterium]